MAGARETLTVLAGRLTDLAPAMARIGTALEGVVERRFASERGPGGNPWIPSRRARTEGGQTLTLSGRLRRSITARTGPDFVELGSDVVYAAIHQLGGTILPRRAERLAFVGFDGRFVQADRVDIPARPFLGMDEDAWDAVGDALDAHLAGTDPGVRTAEAR